MFVVIKNNMNSRAFRTQPSLLARVVEREEQTLVWVNCSVKVLYFAHARRIHVIGTQRVIQSVF